ncbi:hypothetical protein [Ruminiclostridium papyrosolvens]|uniref:Butirosin biosynthesis protein H N-terminal domain-containing protein n=1 Tax=Ruminiclostridium papyrosolvens C7 TaxID=1330534 RepID=U4QZP1_9FIRM|nr:hypothetical protein [Ruminiclostridium papyrosolvens]EPR09608.1 hypothetical protein L323_15695 [Ruminiclostridium papyrosolvens C7]
MKMCLPIENPPITSFPAIANTLSILWTKKDKILPWVSERYIQLIIRPHHPVTRSDFYDNADTDNYIIRVNHCPFIGWLRNNQTTANFKKFTDYIEHQINNGYYLDACLDNFYLSCSHQFNKNHFIHQTFIYGYDRKNRQVFIADFYDYGKYVRKSVSYKEINKSIEGIDYFINLYKYEDTDYKINLHLLKLSVEDYINCKDSLRSFEFTNKNYNRDILYGLNFYDYIIDVFCKDEIIDIRPFHILYDHKTMMKIRIDYLINIGTFDKSMLEQINSRNDSLISSAVLLRNMVLKYNYNPDKNLLNKIKEKCKALQKSDYDLFSDLLIAMRVAN